jgi:hypothetical protein
VDFPHRRERQELALLGITDPVKGVHLATDQSNILFALFLSLAWGDLGAEVDCFCE